MCVSVCREREGEGGEAVKTFGHEMLRISHICRANDGLCVVKAAQNGDLI